MFTADENDAHIDTRYYETLADALEDASKMTGVVTVEIYDRVTLNTSLFGSYDSITFVGKDTDAEIYLDVQGYITATGKTVVFADLILSKSEGGYITNAGFMNVAFGVYDVNNVIYDNCTFSNGAYASSGNVTFTGCTFYRSYEKYGLWAYGNVDVTVDDCTFMIDRGIKMYAEGAAKTVDLTVKNTDFTAVTDKPAIVLTYGESVTLENNTYSSTGVFELDLDGAPNGTPISFTDNSDDALTCVNDNGACGVLVDGKIYTTVAQAKEAATSGSTVTLLHSSNEKVELPEGVTLVTNDYTAEGVTVKTPVELPNYVVLPDGVDASNYEERFGDNTVTDGTNYYATLQAAVEAVAGNANAVLYCKPGADVGSLQHAPVTNTLTVYGNGAFVSGGAERDFDIGNTDPTGGTDITSDITLTVKYLNGCGAWGTKATEHTVNLVFENCENMGKVFLNGTTGTLNITMTDCAFEGVISEAIYSNANGAITLNRVAFSNLDKAINLNHKALGTQSVSLNDCSFTNCGKDVNADQIPVRVLSSEEGGKSELTVSGCTFYGTPEGGADILLDYGVGTTTATVSGTAANVVVETTNNVGTTTAVTEEQSKNFTNVAPVAQIGEINYSTLEEAFTAAADGATITLLADATPALTSQRAITKAAVIDLGENTLTLMEDDLYFGTTTFKNGTIVVDPSVKPSTAVFWMFANQTLTFDNVKIVATGVTGTYLIGLDGNNSDLNLLNGSEILVENTTALDLDIICVNASTGNDIVIDNSKVNVTNLDGRVFFRGNYTVKGNSEVKLDGITKAGFRIEAGQSLSIEDTASVTITGEPRDGGIHLTDFTATYTKAETANVTATVNAPVAVAQIGETKYTSLQAAVDAVQNGETITLLAGITENVTLNEAVGLYYTIDGANQNMTGTITVNALSDTNDNRRITIKNIKFSDNTETEVSFISAGDSNYYPRLTVDGCTFTGSGNDVAVRLKDSSGAIITNCTGSGLHSFLQNTAGWNLTIEKVIVSNSKSGFALGTVQGVTVKECSITASDKGYGIRIDANTYNNNAVIENCNVEAFIPVVVRKANTASNITFDGTNTMTANNTDGIWCAIGTSEYETNGTMPTAPTGKVVVTLNDSGLNANGIYGNFGRASINGVKYQTVAAALAAAQASNITDVTITLLGEVTKEEAIALDDSFYLYNETQFNSVTFKQEDCSKPYWIAGLYTGSRKNGGSFVFDGVNIGVTGQYIFEGNVVLKNNSSIVSVAEANCFLYYSTTTIEPGSKLKGVIEDFRGGDMIVDGGKADGTYNTEPNVQDAIMTVEWSGAKLTLKNGAYVKINSANEVGRLTVNNGAAVELTASKLDACQWINLADGSELKIDGKSEIVTQKITGAGTIKIDATGMQAGEYSNIKADMSGFTGTVTVTGNATLEAKIENGKIVLYERTLAGSGTETDPYLINNLEELILFRDSVNAGETKYSAPGVHVKLGADIDLANEEWTPIGSAYEDHGFMGNFDGNGKKIMNLKMSCPSPDSDGYAYLGFFGVTEGTDKNNQNYIKNLVIENVEIDTEGHIVAAAIAYPYYTTVSNITVCGNIEINGGNYTAGVLAYTRRCVNASNLTVNGASGSYIDGKQTVGGVISDIQMNGGLTAEYSNFSASGLKISGEKMVGGISGIISEQTLNNATVKNVTLDCNNSRVGTVAGSLGGTSTINNVTVENVTGATAVIGGAYTSGATVQAKIDSTYYATLAEAVAAAQDGDTITLLGDITASEVIQLDKSITIDGNGYKVTSSASRVFRVTASDTEVTLNEVNMVSTAVRVGTNDIRGISIDGELNNVKLTLNDCSVDFTDASATDWTYAVNISGNGTGHTLTVVGGDYEGANVINVNGANNTVKVENATLTSLYPNNDLYYGACIWVLEKQDSSVTATGNTFNGSNAVAFNLGTGTTLTESENIDNTTMKVAKIGEKYYATLEEAFAAANDGDTVKLLQDIALDAMITNTKKITLDLNGKTVSMVYAENATANHAMIINNGNLTVMDNVGNGKLSYMYTGANLGTTYSANTITSNPGSTLTIMSGTIENLTYDSATIAYAVDSLTNGGAGDVTVNIEGGTITSLRQAVRIFANSTTHTGTLNISGGNITGRVIIQNANTKANKAALNITGGTITANTYKTEVLYVGGSNGATIDMQPVVSGGTFKGEITSSVNTGFITGGTFSKAVAEELCAEGYIPVDNGDGTYGVKVGSYVARNTTTGVGYETLAAAIDAANPGETVTILAGNYTTDIAVNKAITVEGETDADGNNLVDITGRIAVYSDATVKNLNVHNEKTGDYDCAVCVNGKNIKLDGMKLTGYNAMRYCYASGDITIKNSTINGSYFAVHFDGSAGGNIAFENCDITGWCSYASTVNSVSYTNCNLDQGNYAGHRYYNKNISFTECDFAEGLKIELKESGTNVAITDADMTEAEAKALFKDPYYVAKGNVTLNDKPVGYDASANSKYYDALQDCINELPEDGKNWYVTIRRDIVLTDTLIIPADKTLTLYLNGYNLTVADGESIETNGDLTIDGEDSIEASYVLASADATLTAGEGLNVTTTVADSKVVYENGVYKVGAKVYVAQIGETKYETLAEAIEKAQANDTITLLSDVADVDATVNKAITIDLGEKTITDAYIIVTDEVTIRNGSIKNTNEPYPLVVQNGGKLTIENVAIEASKSDRAIWVRSGSSLVFDSGSILATKGENNTKTNLIAAIYTDSNTDVTINDGTITVDTPDNKAVGIFGNYTNANVTINGGKISTSGKGYNYGINVDGDITVNGGEIVTNEKGYGYSSGIRYGYNYALVTATGDVTITGGTITTNGFSGYIVNVGRSYSSNDQTVKITGGTFTNNLSEVEKTTGGHKAPVFLCEDNASSVTATISNGTFTGFSEAMLRGSNDDLSKLSVTGGTYDVKIKEELCAEGYIPVKNEDGTYSVIEGSYVAKIGDTGYTSLAEAINAAKDGDTITILAGELSEGTIKLPADLNNVTFKGEEGAVLKNMTIMASDGNAINYDGLTFNGITFDNSRIAITGWRTGGAEVKNLTVTNCTFKNLNDTTNNAPVHINMAATEAVENFTFTNNVIDGATGGSKSGIYAQTTGKTTITGNTINNVSFRPYVIQITTDDGIDDEFIVTGNTFSGSAAGRAQGLTNNAEGTDNVKLVVSENIFKDITNAQQICYWNFNEGTTTADLSKNYYDIDIQDNPNRIYFNNAAQNAKDLIEMGIYPYYADEAKTVLVEAPAIMVTYPVGNPVYPDGKVEYYDDMLEAVPYTTNCPRLEGATITLLKDTSGAGMRFMENDMVFDLNGHTYTITAGTGSQNTNTSGFQIRPEVTTDVLFKNGTIEVAEGAPVVWMFNVYATDFIVENVTVDCTNMAWSYGEQCYVVVSREGDNVQFTGITEIKNFNSEVAGHAINVGGTMTIEDTVVPGGTIELDARATLTAEEGLDVVPVDGYKVVYENGVYSCVAVNYVAQIGETKYETLAEALTAAKDGETITLLWTDGDAPIAMNGAVYGKSVTITGTAQVDWSKGWLYVGRGGVGDGTVIFDNANLTSASDNASTGIHVSGREKGTNDKYDGTLEIKNSNIVLDYLINKGEMTLDNSTLTVKNGFSIGGRPADETESGADATAKITLNNNSKVIVNSHNGMGLGYEAIGVMNVDATSSFETTQSFLVTAKGTLNLAGTANIAGTLTNNGSIVLTDVAAKLTSSECGNVTTDVDGHDVVYADGAYSVTEKATFVAQIGEGETAQKFTSLQEAIDAAQAGETVTLLDSIALSEGVIVEVNDEITLELNGKTISRNTEEQSSTAAITNNGNLTIQDSIGGGKITAFAANPDTADIPYYASNTITNCGVLTIKSGKIENSTGNDARAAFPIDNNSTSRNAIVNIEGGTVTGRGAIRQFANSTIHENEVNITGGTVDGTSYGIWMQNPGSGDPTAALKISGNANVAKILISPSAEFKPSITGGTISEVAIWNADTTNTDRNPSGFITGGTFNMDVNEFCAKGYKAEDNDDGTWTVVPNMIFEMHLTDANGDAHWLSPMSSNDPNGIIETCKVWYDSLQGTYRFTLKILENYEVEEPIVVNFPMTLDLNGKTLTGTEKNGEQVYPMIRVQNGASVTVKNGSMVNDDYVFVLGASDGSSEGYLTIESGSYTGETTVASVTKGELTVTGGEFKTTEGEYDATYLLNCIDANYKDGSAKITVTGGTFHGFNPENNAAEGEGTNFVAVGYRAVDNQDNSWTVSEWNGEIWTKEDLEYFAALVDAGVSFEGKTVKLMADIDLYEVDENGERVTFNPIGNNSAAVFDGTFDGQYHTIKNLYQSGWALGYEWGKSGYIGLFSYVWNATVKNLTIENAESFVEGGITAGIAGCAYGDCTFENITIKNSKFATYNSRAAGIVGWAGKGNYTFKGITVDDDTVIAGLWGSFDSTLGGVVGELVANATASFEDIDVACRLDAYNDVTASYKWYSYRMCGMLIGRVNAVKQISNGSYNPDPAENGVEIGDNVHVTFGDWANYTYLWDDSLSRGCQRVEAGYTYGGVDITEYPDADISYIPFKAIFGGPQSQSNGYYGLEEYPDVHVNIPAEARIGDVRYWSLADALAAAKTGETVVLLKDATVYDEITVTTTEDIAEKNITLDLGGHSVTGERIYPVIRIQGGAELTVKNGSMVNDDYVFVLGASDSSSEGYLTIESGSYTGETTVASVTKGKLTITGGEFKTTVGEYGATYLLNCIDANYKDGSAEIVVTGGRFYGFNPENNAAEGAGTNFVADGYKAVDNADGTWTVVEDKLFDISFARMNLANSLNMHFAFEAGHKEDWTGAYVKIIKEYANNTIETQTIQYADWGKTTIDDVRHYYVAFSGIAAKEMADSISVTVYNAEDEAISNEWIDSVRDYAMRTLSNVKTSREERVMVVDMLNYGAAAQKFFNYNSGDLANNKLTDEQKNLATSNATANDKRIEGANFLKSNLDLVDSIHLMMAFKDVDQTMKAVISYTDHYGNKTNVEVDGKDFELNNGAYVISINSIVVADARQLIKCEIFDGETVVAECTDSIESYVARELVVSDESDELFNMIIRFSDSAYNYLHMSDNNA